VKQERGNEMSNSDKEKRGRKNKRENKRKGDTFSWRVLAGRGSKRGRGGAIVSEGGRVRRGGGGGRQLEGRDNGGNERTGVREREPSDEELIELLLRASGIPYALPVGCVRVWMMVGSVGRVGRVRRTAFYRQHVVGLINTFFDNNKEINISWIGSHRKTAEQ
jgi:hypothetical protein